MQVLVIFVSRHKRALKVFEEQGNQILSNLGQLENKCSLTNCTFDPDRAKGLSFEQFIAQGGVYETVSAEKDSKVDGVVVLHEENLGHLLSHVRNAIFAAQIPTIGYIENIQNFLIGHFSVLLKNYGVLMNLMQDSMYCQAACLPIRNFDAEELRRLVEICQTRSLERTFQNEITPSINKILKLRGPKRRSKYPNVYFKDSRNLYFQYGHEHHSRYETGGAHTAACSVNGYFRFGNEIDQERHFNVSVGDSDEKTHISTNFPNCHDDIVEIKGRTHINMFSNDFHK